jgi:hypothetical protein
MESWSRPAMAWSSLPLSSHTRALTLITWERKGTAFP